MTQVRTSSAGEGLQAEGVVTRSRAVVMCLLMTVIAMRISAPQQVEGAWARVAAGPRSRIERALDLWTSGGSLGEASAQGVREIPLALFSWLGDLLGLSVQAIPSLWLASVLVLALLGAERLARGGSPADARGWTAWVAAALYACGPVLVASALRSPGDGLVAAFMPWALVPLVRRSVGWRAAASSAVWLGAAGVGAVHWAAAAFVVAGLVAFPRSRVGAAQFLRWLLLALLASSWWIGAAVWELAFATDVTWLIDSGGLVEGVAQVLGQEDWGVGRLALVSAGPLLIALSAVLAPTRADRAVLVRLLVASVVVAGTHLVGGWDVPVLAPSVLDGHPAPGAPVLAWLGLAAVVAWVPLMDHLRESFRREVESPLSGRALPSMLVAVALALTSSAGLVFAIREPPADTGPAYTRMWRDVAAWSEEAPEGRVLVLPASESRTEPAVVRALGDRPWVGRDPVPVSGAAATNALDDLIRRLTRGQGGDETAEALRRLGVSYVLLRNDTAPSADRERPAALVRAALEAQGASRVAVFFGGGAPDGGEGTALLDFGVRAAVQSVEIWSVGPAAGGWVYDGGPLEVGGDAGATTDLAAAGVLGSRAVRLASGQSSELDILSDSARHRDVDQREASDPYGPDLPGDAEAVEAPEDAAPSPTAVRRFEGARSVRASSSSADLDGSGRRVGAHPGAAVDGNAFTGWHSRRGTGVGEWWQVELDEATDMAGATVQVIQNAFGGHRVSRIRVETDTGATELDVPSGGLLTLGLSGQSTRLRVTATAVQGETGPRDTFGIAEVSLPGAVIRDVLAVRGTPTEGWVLAARPGNHATCVPAAPGAGRRGTSVEPGVVCDRALSAEGPDVGDLDRVLEVRRPTAVTGRAWVRAADGEAAGRMVERLARPSVLATGTSVSSPDLVTGPQAAADDDASTAWRPASEDPEPALTLSWSQPSQVTGLDFEWTGDGLASIPTRIRIVAQPVRRDPSASPTASTFELAPDDEGAVRFPAVTTREIRISFLEDTEISSIDSATGGTRAAPIGVAEVRPVGGPELSFDSETVHLLPCGSGPVVHVGGEEVATAVVASAGDLLRGSVVRAGFCSRPVLGAGEQTVSAEASFAWIPLGVVLSSPGGALGDVSEVAEAAASSAPRVVPVEALAPGRESIRVELAAATSEATLALAVPVGKGWVATLGDKELRPVTLYGWAQGWRIPPGADDVRLSYSAGGLLRSVLGVTAFGFVVVLLVAVVGGRRLGRRRRF